MGWELKPYVKDWLADNRWFLTIGLLTLLGVIAWGGYIHCCSDNEELHLPSKVIFVLIALLTGWFFDIFTGDADKRKVNQMVAFCYVFPFAIFTGMLIPLFAYPVALPDPPKPIGIILGCSDRPIMPVDKNPVPDGIRCNNNANQWLVNIGGNAIYVDDATRAEAEAVTEGAARAKLAADADARGKLDGTAKQDNANVGAGGRAIAAAKPTETMAPADKSPATAGGKDEDTGRRTSREYEIRDQFRVTGGLVVPLYFVILSVFGGFVSMLRRVPEYQERVSPGASDPLSFERAREKLVFEVLQLLAAPLIAITAYYLVDPASRATSITLAFIAGFSSETVLLYVRALSEKLQPQTIRRAPEVELAPTAVVFGRQAVGSASSPRLVRLTNRSATRLSGTVSVTGDFVSNPSGAFTVEPGSSATFSLTFHPTTPGKAAGELQLKHDGPGSPAVVGLTGQGA